MPDWRRRSVPWHLMRRHMIVPLTLAAALALGACSGGGSGKAVTTTPATGVQQLSSSSWEVAEPTPSTSAKMVCQKEAREEIASSLGVTETRVTTPTWDEADHLYSCTYVYPKGTITLSVKEMSNEAETTAYFDGIAQKYGTTQALIGSRPRRMDPQEQRRRGAQGLQSSPRRRPRYSRQLHSPHGTLRRRDQHRVGDHGLLVGPVIS